MLSWVILAPVAHADQGCQGDHCPVIVNTLLQASREAIQDSDEEEAAVAEWDGAEEQEEEEADTDDNEQAASPTYTHHAGMECGWEADKSASAAGLSSPNFAGTVADGQKHCNAQAKCVGFVASSTKIYLKSSVNHQKCANGSTKYDTYFKHSGGSHGHATYTHVGTGQCKSPGGWSSIYQKGSGSQSGCKTQCTKDTSCIGYTWSNCGTSCNWNCRIHVPSKKPSVPSGWVKQWTCNAKNCNSISGSDGNQPTIRSCYKKN